MLLRRALALLGLALVAHAAKPVGSMAIKAATNKLVELSDTVGAWQELWNHVDVDLTKSARLETKVADLVADISDRWSSATGDNSQSYWGYGFKRLQFEYYKDSRQHQRAFDAALDIIAHPSCSDEECASSTVNAAMYVRACVRACVQLRWLPLPPSSRPHPHARAPRRFQAYRLFPGPDGSALTTRVLDAVAARTVRQMLAGGCHSLHRTASYHTHHCIITVYCGPLN